MFRINPKAKTLRPRKAPVPKSPNDWQSASQLGALLGLSAHQVMSTGTHYMAGNAAFMSIEKRLHPECGAQFRLEPEDEPSTIGAPGEYHLVEWPGVIDIYYGQGMDRRVATVWNTAGSWGQDAARRFAVALVQALNGQGHTDLFAGLEKRASDDRTDFVTGHATRLITIWDASILEGLEKQEAA
jgi:hypothetical protein